MQQESGPGSGTGLRRGGGGNGTARHRLLSEMAGAAPPPAAAPGMRPRRTPIAEERFICQGVPYTPQIGPSCWHSAFNMVNRKPPGDVSDHTAMQRLFRDGTYQPIPKSLLSGVIEREGLWAIAGCQAPGKNFSVAELQQLLERHGPVAFAWRPEYNPLFTRQAHRYHWSVMIHADPASASIVYHDPVAGRHSHTMTLDEFNRQRVRDHDHAMLRARNGGDSGKPEVQWSASAPLQ